MNLSDLREAIRVKTGYPERGETGSRRLNNVINQSLRTLWGEIPEVLLRTEERLELEPPRKFTVVLDSTDKKAFVVSTGETPFSNSEISQRILSGRWFEWQYNGKWYQRRVSEAFVDLDDLKQVVAVTEPVPTEIASTSTAMTAYIYTYEYPYDADIQSIRRIVKNPETNPREVPISVIGAEMTGAKIGTGWQSQGDIQYFSRGDFYQQEAPHYKPQASRLPGNQADKDQWGFNGTTGAENTEYGPAGEFSYRVCHVWGRLPPTMGQIDGAVSTVGASSFGPDIGYPFYISSPSKESDKVSCNWGEPAIKIVTPDIEYIYGFGQDADLRSSRRSGVEKWIFRARHSTSTTDSEGSGSVHKGEMEDDGVYYLWQVVDGSTKEVVDRGDFDPVARKYQLKDFMGHYHIRFDKRPTAKDQILMSCIKRPPTLGYDTDSPNLPPECYACIIELACSYLVGDRDGDIKRKSMYYDAHLIELQKLKRMYTFSGHERPTFGNGIKTTSYFRTGDYPVTETS